MADEIKELDVLEQVKRIDKAVKAKMLIEKIALLKEFAREINELREKSVAILEELGLSDKDMKRIIDYINELPEVKLSERDKKQIREEVSDDVDEEKESIEKTLRNIDLDKLMTITTTAGANSTGAWNLANGVTYTTSANVGEGVSMFLANASGASYVANLDDGAGHTLSVKL